MVPWCKNSNLRAGDIQDGQPEVTTTVGDVVDDLYDLRNVIAHGDKPRTSSWVVARTNTAKM